MDKFYKISILISLTASIVTLFICINLCFQVNKLHNGSAPTRTPLWFIFEQSKKL